MSRIKRAMGDASAARTHLVDGLRVIQESAYPPAALPLIIEAGRQVGGPRGVELLALARSHPLTHANELVGIDEALAQLRELPGYDEAYYHGEGLDLKDTIDTLIKELA
ncbi:MAG: hypothetical protein ACFB51_21660 [Anaerolineae bacterium]